MIWDASLFTSHFFFKKMHTHRTMQALKTALLQEKMLDPS